MRGLTRRAVLLGGAGLLAGCESITDSFDRIFGERKVPLKGDRKPILAAEKPLDVDAGDTRPVTLPPPTMAAEWPQAGGTIGHAPGHPALGPGLRQVWSTSIGTGAAYRRRLIAPPILAGGTVFAVDAYGEVTALDAATGRERWSLDTRPKEERDGALGAGLAWDGGTLYAVTSLAEAMSIDPATGKVGWRVALPAPTRGAPTVAGGRLFVVTTENHLIALSTDDGQRQWTYRGQSVTTMVLGLPAPAVDGEVVVAGFASGELVAVRAQDGRMIWSETLASARGGSLADIAAIAAMPVIDRGRVIAAGLGGITIALDLRSGRRLWEREVAVGETPWVAGDWVFLVTTGGELACLGREDGRVRWIGSLGRFENPEKRRDPITWGPPVLAGGRLLVAGSHGRMVEVNPAEGEKLAEIRLPGGTTLEPAVAEGTLYLLTDDGSVVAFRGSAGAA
ncbi:outer membrane protein assembly factor BamB family protein [Paracraurococcus lichenis]|uniref:PQQ-binding-like beta-propeller repeat protein n=1 Tax=Paracraurococcus lichenis TaxID=3064888 RepID=A0ABT9DSX7_9PROT|nr:PQQ-binding-like beta-propeller repeat protein [Paracraurococcus sp. LOR1-02]MDO9707006.1 PQQ-binding-like beta-propeller repeat protein [Paracraurococcus sp. LOR1-02]